MAPGILALKYYDPCRKMSDEDFERHTLAILQRELGLDGLARVLRLIDRALATTPATATDGWKVPQSRKSWPK